MSWKDLLYKKSLALKQGTEHLVYGRPILRGWAAATAREDRPIRVLDVGCGYGDDLAAIRDALGGRAELFGLEGYAPYRERCAERGIDARDADVERDHLPFADGSLDVVLMNQVLEHTKDLFWIFSEVSRVLPPHGLFLIGVPNLAAWHDRAMLLVGMQPSGMKGEALSRPGKEGTVVLSKTGKGCHCSRTQKKTLVSYKIIEYFLRNPYPLSSGVTVIEG
jgi:SAM-dependent methyltransferase